MKTKKELKKFNIPDYIYRGYDIRGVVGEDLTGESMYILGKAYGTFLQKRRITRCVAGYDSRESSENLVMHFVNGLIECGIECIDIGMVTSPIMYFAQYAYLSKGGVIVTGSHNPIEYNGMKLGISFSETTTKDELDEIREIVEKRIFYKAKVKGKIQRKNVFPKYREFLRFLFPEKVMYKVVVDTANSTPGLFAGKIFKDIGCVVYEYNTRIDSSFPNGTPDPTEESFQRRLSSEVLARKADFGFSFDSDGDRIGIVDDSGNIIWNDVLLCIFAKDVLERGPAKITFNSLCSMAVSEVIKSQGGEPYLWLTGHSFIKEKIREIKAPFGGELSGHFFFMDNFFGHDDGFYAALRLLSYCFRNKKKLSEIVSSLPRYISSPEIKIGSSEEVKFKAVEKISRKLKKTFKYKNAYELDGIRLEWESGMVVVRASSNGPYITLRFEAKTQKEYEKIRKILKDMILKMKEINGDMNVNIESLTCES